MAFLLAFLAYALVWLVVRPTPTGDEGHYLAIAHSLARDGDIDVANDYGSGDLAQLDPALSGLTSGTHAARYRPDGPLVSTHGHGLAFILAPIVLTGGGLIGVRLLLIALAAALAAQVHAILATASPGDPLLRWAVWAATFLTLPIILYSNQVYPELPAALLMAIAAHRLIQPSPSRGSLVAAASAIALMPWLHVRFLGIAFVLGVALLVRAQSRGGIRLAATVGGIPALSVLALATTFHHVYGSPLPGAPFEPAYGSSVGFTLENFHNNVLGSVLSPATGWLPFAPVHWIGFVGLVMLAGRKHWLAPWALAAIALYAATLSISSSISNGWSFPGRLVLVFVPFVALPLLAALRTRRILIVLFIPLFVLSLAFTGAAVADHDLLYPQGSIETELPMASALEGIWPRFPQGVREFDVEPSGLSRTIGRLVAGPDGPATIAVAIPGVDLPGWLAFGPYLPLLDGAYRAVFDLALAPSDLPQHTMVAQLSVTSRSGRVVHASMPIRISDRTGNGSFDRFELPFVMPAARKVEARVFYEGAAEIRLRRIHVAPVFRIDGSRDWDRAIMWIGVTALVGMRLARVGANRAAT